MSMEPTQHPARRAGRSWFVAWLCVVAAVAALIVLGLQLAS